MLNQRALLAIHITIFGSAIARIWNVSKIDHDILYAYVLSPNDPQHLTLHKLNSFQGESMFL